MSDDKITQPVTVAVEKLAATDLFVNPDTGLVALKFLGIPADPADKDSPRYSDIGYHVGEVAGHAPAAAQTLVAKGYAVPVPRADVEAAIKADRASRAAAKDAEEAARHVAQKLMKAAR